MLLNLIMYNDDAYYNRMRDILRRYLSTLSDHVMYLFYCYSETIQEDYVIEGDTLYIKGVESFVPGTADKTFKALRIVLDLYEFTHIVRSNISTIINFDLLTKYMAAHNVEYGGYLTYVVQQPNPFYGVTAKHFGITFVSGSCIIMSRATVSMLADSHNIDYTTTDDMNIGVLCSNNRIGITLIDGFIWNSDLYLPHKIFYRNKRADRANDCTYMSRIVDRMICHDVDHTQLNKISAEYGPYNGSYIDVSRILAYFIENDNNRRRILRIPKTIVMGDCFGNPFDYNMARRLIIHIRGSSVIIDETRDYNVQIDLDA